MVLNLSSYSHNVTHSPLFLCLSLTDTNAPTRLHIKIFSDPSCRGSVPTACKRKRERYFPLHFLFLPLSLLTLYTTSLPFSAKSSSTSLIEKHCHKMCQAPSRAAREVFVPEILPYKKILHM